MGKKGKPVDDAATKREEPLQAVLLADSFVNTFRPISLDQPKVLCPLNNVSLIDYSIEYLAGVGVEELLVVCVSDDVEAHVEEQAVHHPSMEVHVVKDSSWATAGEALRELDRRDLVKSDPFILMFGDVVTNVDLSEAMKAHKERHKKDRSAIMTLLLKSVGETIVPDEEGPVSYAPIRPHTDDLVVALDPDQDNRVLVYDDHCTNGTVPVPCSFFASHSQIEIRTDLLDCGVYICSPDVLARFTDEFDYQDIRRDFVYYSVAEEEEGLQNKVFAHILPPSEYAARVHDFATYAAVSQDLLRRWCYPVVPERPPKGYDQEYRCVVKSQYMYYERMEGDGRVGRTSTVSGAGMIGYQSAIGEESVVQATVIGDHCEIGSRVKLDRSFLWDNVEIEDGATVIESILASDCVIKAGAVVNKGCIIGPGVVVGSNVELPEFTRLTTSMKEDENDDFGDDWGDGDEGDGTVDTKTTGALAKTNTDLVGNDGVGHAWSPPLDDDDDDELYGLSTTERTKSQCIGFDPTELLRNRKAMQVDDANGVDRGAAVDEIVGYASEEGMTFADDAPGDMIIGRQKGVDVIKELKTICLEFEATSPIENLAIELNSFKFSQNATYVDCTIAATLAIMERMQITPSLSDGKLISEFKAALTVWGPLLQKMSIGLDEEKGVITALETCATGDDDMAAKLSKGMPFRLLLQILHDEEIVSEEAIKSWAAGRRDEDPDSPAGRLFASAPVQDFLEWLEASSDEESEEEEDDDDDEEDSE